MTSANQEIVTSYEHLNMSPEEISIATGFEVGAIKGILLACSGKFREANKEAEKSGESDAEAFITDEEDKEFTDALKNLARNSDNDVVRARILMRLVDEKRGRNAGKNIVKREQTTNILVFNQRLLEARAAKAKAMKELDGVIDVGETKVEMIM